MLFSRIFEIPWSILLTVSFVHQNQTQKESDKEMHTATEDCDKTESVFLVNNENPGDIKLTFKKTKISRYSGSPSTI